MRMRFKTFILVATGTLLALNNAYAVTSAILDKTKSEIRTGCISRMAEIDAEHKKTITPSMVTSYVKICSCVIDHPKTQASLTGLAEAIEERSKDPTSAEAKTKGDQHEAAFEKATDEVIVECVQPNV